MTKLGELASHLGYWVVYRNWYGKISYLIYRWDEHVPVFGQSFPTEEEALAFLAPIGSQPRWRLSLNDPSVTVERAPYGVIVTENRTAGRSFSAPVLTELMETVLPQAPSPIQRRLPVPANTISIRTLT